MFKPLTIFLTAFYGLIWTWAATSPWSAFIVLMIVGLFSSLPVFADGIMKALPYIILGSLVSAAGVAFPPLGFVVAIIMIWLLTKKMRSILSHLVLIFIGIAFYMILFYAPAHLFQYFSSFVSVGIANVVVFATGVTLYYFIIVLLKEFNYEENKIALYLMGFPAFIFLIIFKLHDFSGGDN